MPRTLDERHDLLHAILPEGSSRFGAGHPRQHPAATENSHPSALPNRADVDATIVGYRTVGSTRSDEIGRSAMNDAEIRAALVRHETISFGEPWQAPAWRAPWVETMPPRGAA